MFVGMEEKLITEIILANYRSLGPRLRISPARLSVLVGQNGSGKSNILDALSFVRDSVTQGLPAAITHRGGIDSVRRRSLGRPFDVHVELGIRLPCGSANYGFVVTGDRKEEYRVKSEKAFVSVDGEICQFERQGGDWKGLQGVAPRIDDQSLALTALGGTQGFKPLVDFLSGITVYSIFPDALRVPQRFDAARPMEEHGGNWVSVLRDLVRDANAKTDLVTGLSKLTGDIEDVRVTSAAGHLIAEFKQHSKAKKSKQWFDAAQQSDGTLRVAGLLTALLQQPNLPFISIEEPELTVHPGVLPMLYDYLRQCSEVSQILLTTHSPIILDVLDLEMDAVFVVQRTNGITEVKKAEGSHLELVRRNLLRLGEIFQSGDLQLSLFPVDEGDKRE